MIGALVKITQYYASHTSTFVNKTLIICTSGFAFVDFADHKTAVEVRRVCYTTKKILFGRQIRNVDWADFQQVFSEDEVNSVSFNLDCVFWSNMAQT